MMRIVFYYKGADIYEAVLESDDFSATHSAIGKSYLERDGKVSFPENWDSYTLAYEPYDCYEDYINSRLDALDRY
jgi:hypothetical protein